MKKILYTIFAIALTVPTIASAATFSFAPTSATFKLGQTFSTAVFVTPGAGEKITTAKLSLDFSSGLLEVVSFTPTTGWIALPLPGSDLIDNAKGKLIKTGGLPAKVTSKKQFGTIVFKAKKAGSAKIGTNAGSMLIDTSNTDKYVASTGASFSIAELTPTSKPKPAKKKPAHKKSTSVQATTVKKSTQKQATTSVAQATTTVTDIKNTNNQVAAVASAPSTKSSNSSTMYLVGALGVIIGLIVWWFTRKRFSKHL